MWRDRAVKADLVFQDNTPEQRAFPGPLRAQPRRAALLAAAKEHTPESYATTCKSLLHWGRRLPGQENEPVVTSLLANIRYPTLVVCGAKDFWIPPKFSRIIAEKIPGARYVEMAHCGHTAVREDPAGSARLIRDFTGGLAANPRAVQE